MFPQTKSRETLTVEGEQNSLIPQGADIKCFVLQGVPKKPQTIENNLLLEFQWPSTNLQVKSVKDSDTVHILSILVY